MKIVADQNMPALDETFGRHGVIQRLNGREICRSDLAAADVLLVRSVTRVNEDLLRDTDVRFVGSATIGIDHLDTAWLEENQINWAHAPGCNANAAAQYALAMMWLACERLQRDFSQQTVGIIGRGNVGQRLERLLQTLGIPVVCCDPPLQDKGEQRLVSMQEACDNSIISLHVPLTTRGPHPTRNLFDSRQLGKLRTDTLLVNTSRGAVIEKSGLLESLYNGRLQAALDVWPDEPLIETDMLNAVTVATPHVAGYSREGKLAGTEMIYQAFCKAFSAGSTIEAAPAGKVSNLDFPACTAFNAFLRHCIQSSSQVPRDDAALRKLAAHTSGDSRVHIDHLRASYPERFEFKSHCIRGLSVADAGLMRQLGFKTA